MNNENLKRVLHDEGFLSPKDKEITRIFTAIKADDLQGVKPPVYEYWKSKNDDNYYWHCKGGNGEIMWQGETNGYTTKRECLAAIDRCQRYAKHGSTVKVVRK